MPPRPARHDRYGRPLPRLADAAQQDLTDSPANRTQRRRILRRIQATMEQHYPHLLQRAVSAEVTLSFKIVKGTIQEDVYLGIVWQYRDEEDVP
jgi:hypothetical protein